MNGDNHPVGSPSAESGRAELLACPFCGNPPDYEHTESEASIYCRRARKALSGEKQ